MKQEPRYVQYYKRTLEKSTLHGVAFDDQLQAAMADPLKPACLITKMFDTGDEDCTFHRLKVDGDFAGVKLEVVICAASMQTVFVDDQLVQLEDFFADPDVDFQKKLENARALSHVRGVNTQDMILHSMTGRYLWVLVAVYPAGDAKVTLRGLRLDFQKDPFTKYFPEIYQENPFFDRFVGIFQSMYLDLERQVDELPARLDYETTEPKLVEELAGWLGIDNSQKLFNTSQLRQMIRKSDLFQGAKGTRRAMEAIIELTTGIRPQIVEYFQWHGLPMNQEREELGTRLYGAGSEQFCVILDLSRRREPLPLSQQDLEKLITLYSGIGTRHKLVFLYRNSHTDNHSYLDVNACLSTPEQISVDGVSLGGQITL